MPQEPLSPVVDLAILAGFASLIVLRPAGAFWLLPLLLLFLFAIRRRALPAPAFSCRACFIPFVSGLLAWPLRLFYWDRVDLSLRIRNLSVLAALFALYFLARERRWPNQIPAPLQCPGLEKKAAGHLSSAPNCCSSWPPLC